MNTELNFIEKATVLVVDDMPDNLALIAGLLKDDYIVKAANTGEKALKIAQSDSPPSLILLDVMMPGMDGYEVCRQLKSDPATRNIPIIFLTAKSEVDDEKIGLELGAVDYLTKPVSPPIVMARVKNHLALKAYADLLRNKSEFLEGEVARRTREVMAIQDVTILAMASMAETRDTDTGNHIRRTQFYVKVLADKLKIHPRFTMQSDRPLHHHAVQVRTPARHRQGGHSGPHSAQARAVHRRRIPDHEDPYDARS